LPVRLSPQMTTGASDWAAFLIITYTRSMAGERPMRPWWCCRAMESKGFAETMSRGGVFPPIKKLMTDFLGQGGVIKVCKPCIAERNISEEDLLDTVETTAGVAVNIAALMANAVLVF